MKITKVHSSIWISVFVLSLVVVRGLVYGSSPNKPKSSNENGTKNQDKNGEHLGYIKSISTANDKYSLKIDYIQWINCSYDEKTDSCNNGFEIVNSNPLVRTFPISGKAIVEMQTLCHHTSGIDKGNFKSCEISLIQLKAMIDGTIVPSSDLYIPTSDGADESIYAVSATDSGLPFSITLRNGVVTKIAEQYIP